MDKSIFQYIWRNSKGQQLTIMAMTACSFPFLLMALNVIVGRAAHTEIPPLGLSF